MNKPRLLIAKALALIYGLLGLTWLFMGLAFIPHAFAQREPMMIVVIFSFLAFGSILAAISYQVLLKNSPQSQKNLCGLIGLTVFSLLNNVLRPATNITLDSHEMSAHSALMIIPIVLGVVAYKVTIGLFGTEKK